MTTLKLLLEYDGTRYSGWQQQANARTVEKSGGAANAGDLPEEFRDALQSYFQQLEDRAN